MHRENIAVIIDEDNGSIIGIYDISKMTGDIVDYYSSNFDSIDEWEDDMLGRGAVHLKYDEYNI